MKATSKKFARKSPEKALIFGLAQSLILKGRVKTTFSRGREASNLTEKLITLGKKETLSGQRLLRRYLSDIAVKKIVKDLVPRYQERAGGYTRLIKLERRLSDGAEIVFIELIQ